MNELRIQQVEALEAALEYSKKLSNGIKNVSEELKGNRQPDTDEYLNQVINGLNWVIEVVNGTMSLLNEKEEVFVKEDVNTTVGKLSEALQAKDDAAIADILENGVLAFVDKLTVAAEAVVGAN